MVSLNDIEGLSIHDDCDEDGFCFDVENEGEEVVDLRWCLVGRFYSDRLVHLKSMKIRIEDLWRPVKGITIK